MIKSYKRLLDMESVATLKLEQDRLVLENLRKVLIQNKRFIVDKLTRYLKNELNLEYKFYVIVDQDGNYADILVSRSSNLFERFKAVSDSLEFTVECFLNKKMFNNKDEIIILDVNSDNNNINLEYLCDSLNYKNLSYSDERVARLSFFLDYVINKQIKFRKK